MLLSPASKRFLTRYMDLVDELNLQELFNKASLEFNDRIINEITSALLEVGISPNDIHQAKVNNCIKLLDEAFEDIHNRKYVCDGITLKTFFEVYLLNKLGLTEDDVYQILSENQSKWNIAVYERTDGYSSQKFISIL